MTDPYSGEPVDSLAGIGEAPRRRRQPTGRHTVRRGHPRTVPIRLLAGQFNDLERARPAPTWLVRLCEEICGHVSEALLIVPSNSMPSMAGRRASGAAARSFL